MQGYLYQVREPMPRKWLSHFFRPGDPPEARGFRDRVEVRRGLLSLVGASKSRVVIRWRLVSGFLSEDGTKTSPLSWLMSLGLVSSSICRGASLAVLLESSLMQASSS